MKSRKTLNGLSVLSVLSVLIIVGAAVLAWSVNADRQTATHAAAMAPQLKDFQLNMGSGSVYQFHRLTQGTWGSTTSQTFSSIDSGTWQMSQGGKVIGTTDLSEKISSSVRGASGRYEYQIQFTSTVPGLPSSSGTYYDYPVPSPIGNILPADYSSIEESPMGDVAVKYATSNYKIASPDIEGNPNSNTSAYYTAGAAFSTGYYGSQTMQSAITQQNDAYNSLLNYTRPGAAMIQPSSAVESLAFRQIPLPKSVLMIAASGGVMWFTGIIVSTLCNHNFCKKASNLLGAIFGELSGIGTLLTLVTGVSISGILTIMAAQANRGNGDFVNFARGAEWGMRIARLGIPWAAANRMIPNDIENAVGNPVPFIDHLD
jgi:hypothetical protein